MYETKFTAQEQVLVKWCYDTVGYTRPLLAQHFECTVAEIQEIVSGGLPREQSPAASAAEDKPQPRKLEFQADSLLRPQAENSKVDRIRSKLKSHQTFFTFSSARSFTFN